MALSRVANSSLNQTQEFHFTANASFGGANTFFSGTKTRITSANTFFSGANIVFANTTHVNFTGANVVGLTGLGGGSVDTNTSTRWERSITFERVGLGTVGLGAGNSNITLNLANGNFFDITVGNNIVITNPLSIGNSTVSNVQSGSIFLKQDSTGNRTVSFGQYWRFPSGAAPSLSTAAGSQDRIDFVVFSSNTIQASVTLDLLGT
jgi:hypothetical protein